MGGGNQSTTNDMENQEKDNMQLPENAFRPLREGEQYEPIMNAGRAYPEVNARYQIGVLTKAEEARAAPYRAFAKQFLQNTLQMDEGEIESFIGECTDEYGDIVDDKVKGILTQRLRDLGVL